MSAAHSLPTSHGRLWWIADNDEQAQQWAAELAAKGATVERIEAHDNSAQHDVIFTLEKARAEAICGYPVDDVEWLED